MAEFVKEQGMQDALQKLKEKKKKKEEELKELEEQKKKELEETDKEIKTRTSIIEKAAKEKAREEEAFQESATHKTREELAEINATLEELVRREKLPEERPQQIEYLIGALKSEEAPIYSVTNYNVFNQLQEIRNRVASGEYITSQEREFIEETRKQTQRFITDQDYLSEKDPHDYVSRADDILHQIDAYVHLRKKER